MKPLMRTIGLVMLLALGCVMRPQMYHYGTTPKGTRVVALTAWLSGRSGPSKQQEVDAYSMAAQKCGSVPPVIWQEGLDNGGRSYFWIFYCEDPL